MIFKEFSSTRYRSWEVRIVARTMCYYNVLFYFLTCFLTYVSVGVYNALTDRFTDRKPCFHFSLVYRTQQWEGKCLQLNLIKSCQCIEVVSFL